MITSPAKDQLTSLPISGSLPAARSLKHEPHSSRAVEQTVRAWHRAGRSQRAIARDLGIDRRKIKRIIDHPT